MSEGDSSGTPSFQRARTRPQKAERERALIDAARESLEQGTDPWALSLAEVARRAGMAKSNVYRYFGGLESVLLAVLADEWLAFGEAVGRRMDAAVSAGARGPDELAGLLSASFAHRPLLCQLQSALPTIMERNLDPEEVATFKRDGLHLVDELARGMQRVEPRLTVREHGAVIRVMLVLVGGLWPLAHPRAPERSGNGPPIEPDDAVVALRFEFESDLHDALARVLRGSRATSG